MDLFSLGGRRTLAAGVVVSIASAVAPTVLGSGAESARLDVLDSAAWLASESAGNVVRVNGQTGRVDARIDLGEVASDLTVAQARGTVLVGVGDQVRSIDVANLDWGAATDAKGELVVGDDAAYMVTAQGVVREVDAASLETKGEVDLGQAPGRGVVIGERLVVPLDDGTVAVVDGDEVAAEVDAGGDDDFLYVTQLGDRATILNTSRSALRVLDPASGEATDARDVDLPEGELVVPRTLPGGPLWLLAARSGELVGLDPATGKGPRGPVVAAGHSVTEPAAVDDRVYVVDKTAGEIVAVDAATGGVVRREALGLPDASRVELIARGGKAFVNDRAGNLAVVIDGDEYRRVDKYTDEGVATPTPPTDLPDPGPGPQPSSGPSPAPGPQPGPTPAPAPGPAGPPVSAAPAPPPAEPPAPPTAVEATAGNESATVRWAAGAGGAATSYRIAYDGLGTPMEVGGGELSREVTGLTNGESYTFEVWAVNDVGESVRVASNAVEPNDEVPGAPTDVAAVTEADAEAEVSWSEADGRGNDITGYLVTSSPGGITAEAGAAATSVAVPGLTNGTAYTFTVVAINELGNQSAASDPSDAVTPWGPPGQVPNVVPAEGDRSIGLTWGDAPSATPVTYRIEVTPDGGAPAEIQQPQYSVSGLTNGVQYTVRITPFNDRGNGPTRELQATPGTHATISGTSVSQPGDRRFTVSFNVDDGGRPVQECWVSGGPDRVDCTVQNGSASATITVNQFANSYTFTPHVRTSFSGTAVDGPAVNGTSAGKPLVVDAYSDNRWDGALCTWNGHEGTRPYYAAPNHTCTSEEGYVPDGNEVRAECWTTGGEIRDDNLFTSNRWVRMGRGYMSTLYFEGYRDPDNMVDGLPAC